MRVFQYNNYILSIKRFNLTCLLLSTSICTLAWTPDASTENQTVFVNNKKTAKMAKILYPKSLVKISKKSSQWQFKLTSESTIDNGSSSIITWNEIKNPSASTQWDHWNYGGMAIINQNKVIDSSPRTNNSLIKILPTGDSNYALLEQINGGREGTNSTLIVVHILNKKIVNEYFFNIGDDNLSSRGTYYQKSDINYKDLNKDGYVDIELVKKDFSIVDDEVSPSFKILNTTSILLSPSGLEKTIKDN